MRLCSEHEQVCRPSQIMAGIEILRLLVFPRLAFRVRRVFSAHSTPTRTVHDNVSVDMRTQGLHVLPTYVSSWPPTLPLVLKILRFHVAATWGESTQSSNDPARIARSMRGRKEY